MDTDLDNAEDVADLMCEYINEDEINGEIYLDKDEYLIQSVNIDISIPVDGDDSIVISNGESAPIEMSLPEEVKNTEGELTEEGTVVYNSREDDVAVGI